PGSEPAFGRDRGPGGRCAVAAPSEVVAVLRTAWPFVIGTEHSRSEGQRRLQLLQAGQQAVDEAWRLVGGQLGRQPDRLADRDAVGDVADPQQLERKSTRLNSSHVKISYAVFCLTK